MNKRTLLLFIGIFLIGFIISLFLSPRQKPAPGLLPTTNATPPSFSSLIHPGVTNIPLQYVLPSPTIYPSSLRRYMIRKPQETDLIQLASRLGFSGNPQRFENSSQITLLWLSGKTSFSTQSNPMAFSYQQDIQPTKPLSAEFEKASEEAASKFLLDTVGFGAFGYSVQKETFYFMQYSETQPEYVPDRNQANAGEIKMRLELPDGPVFPEFASAWATIRIDANYNVFSADVQMPPVPIKTDGVLPTLPYNATVARLMSGQGIVVSFGAEGTNQLGDEPLNIQVSKIEKAELGYYYSPDNTELMPVYRFYGTADNNGRPVKTYTLVSAVQ